MIKVTGVRFRQAGKVYYFDPKNLKLERGSHVIVETARGIELVQSLYRRKALQTMRWFSR